MDTPAAYESVWHGNEKQIALINGISVNWQGSLNGGGLFFHRWFVDQLSSRYPNRQFKSVLEWCSGPGFIGFALLGAGIAQKLTLMDINSKAIEMALHTVEESHLHSSVKCIVASTLCEVIDSGPFDLIVGNPPWYCDPKPVIGAAGFVGEMPSAEEIAAFALRSQDSDWKIHREFYANAQKVITPDGLICLIEPDPLVSVVDIPQTLKNVSFQDVRQEPAITTWCRMMQVSGLECTGLLKYQQSNPLFDGIWFVYVEKKRGKIV